MEGNTETGFCGYNAELKENTQEQIYRLYAVGGNQIENMEIYTSINDAYGVGLDNLDNILITFTMEK